MLKYLYGGTFEKCKLFFDTHCRECKSEPNLSARVMDESVVQTDSNLLVDCSLFKMDQSIIITVQNIAEK